MPLQIEQRPPSHLARALAGEAGDVDLDAGLGEREEAGAEADLALGPEDRPRELVEGALEVGEGDPLGDRQPLDLVEDRAVGGVEGVAAVAAPGHDDEDRRPLGLHRAHLHRRGVGAQDDVLGAGRQRVGRTTLRQPRRRSGAGSIRSPSARLAGST